MMKPAIEGGKPIRKKFLLFGKPKITQIEIDEVVNTIRTGWLGTGPKTKKFEEMFRAYIGSTHAIALNSCTAGLHLALDVLGIADGDEVITTPLTFSSTVNVIVHHHAKPIFADVDAKSWNIDHSKIAQKITKKTRVIMPVHLHGRPCAMDEIVTLAKKNKLHTIEDAAHATESWYHGKKIGTISDFTAFSFYVTKNMMTAEGGMLTTENEEWADEARIRSLHGISKDAWKRYSTEGFKPYETLYPGYKYNMIDLLASFGLHQLDRLEKNHAIRVLYWNMYQEAFENNDLVTTPAPEEKNTRHARHLYALLLRTDKLKISRDNFIEALKQEGIGSGIHFSAIHLHKYYRERFGYKPGDFPISEYIGDRTISLPLSPAMNKQDVKDVISAVTKLITYYKK